MPRPAVTRIPRRERLCGMDDCRIPTVDGRYVTLRYDEATNEAVIDFPPPENEDEEPAFGFTPENAERLAEGLGAIRARMAEGAR